METPQSIIDSKVYKNESILSLLNVRRPRMQHNRKHSPTDRMEAQKMVVEREIVCAHLPSDVK